MEADIGAKFDEIMERLRRIEANQWSVIFILGDLIPRCVNKGE